MGDVNVSPEAQEASKGDAADPGMSALMVAGNEAMERELVRLERDEKGEIKKMTFVRLVF